MDIQQELPEVSPEALEWPETDLQAEDGLDPAKAENLAPESIYDGLQELPEIPPLEAAPSPDSPLSMETPPGTSPLQGSSTTDLLQGLDRELPDLISPVPPPQPGTQADELLGVFQDQFPSQGDGDLGAGDLNSLSRAEVDFPTFQGEETRDIPEGLPEHEDLFPPAIEDSGRDPLEQTLQNLTEVLESIKPKASQYGENSHSHVDVVEAIEAGQWSPPPELMGRGSPAAPSLSLF